MADEETIEEKHLKGINQLLERFHESKTSSELVVEVGIDSLGELLREVADLRWQNRLLQKRGGELLEGDRASRRYAKTLKSMANKTAGAHEFIKKAHPELFKEEDDG